MKAIRPEIGRALEVMASAGEAEIAQRLNVFLVAFMNGDLRDTIWKTVFEEMVD